MSSSFPDSFDQFGGDETPPFDEGYRPDPFYDFNATAENSPPPIYASGREFSSDSAFFLSETNANGLIPPPSEMEPQEGYALIEWRRQNAIRLEEKEKKEKELLIQIVAEAVEYKAEFHNKREVTCETNKSVNREKEKVFVASQKKFHAEADKDYWKAIAELIPKEVPAIEKRKSRKEQEKKPAMVVVQGPKPGKPTDLLRMRQILIKLKHNTPTHLKPSPPTAPDAKTEASASSKVPATTPTEAIAVA